MNHSGEPETRHILLPRRGFRFERAITDAHVRELFAGLVPAGATPPRLVAQAPRLGPTLIDVHPAAVAIAASRARDGREPAATLRSAAPEHADVRIVPVVYYHPAWVDRTPRRVVATPKAAGAAASQAGAAAGVSAAPAASGSTAPGASGSGASAPSAAPAAPGDTQVSVTITVVSQATGQPVAQAQVAAVADMITGAGVAGMTDASGQATLKVSNPNQVWPAFFITPRAGFWSYLGENVVLRDGMRVGMQPLDVAYPDALRHFYGVAPEQAGAQVKVGIIDSGVGPHPDLVLAGGRNCVPGAPPDDYSDNGLGHGTHVAGIVGARGTAPQGVRGLAPGCGLYSYQVYAANSGTCTNFSVLTAIDRALADGCDLINLSLSLEGGNDDAVGEALAEARAQGCVVVAAAGNTSFGPRGAVNYPASDPSCVAVSAMGRAGSYPHGTLEVAEAAAPFGTDPDNFIARFSNVGTSIAFTGPGVGIISTFPGGYAVMDGTSMASPAVCGRAAVLLSSRHDVLAMPRSPARADAIVALLTAAAKDLGFGAGFQGRGMP